ncbi:hypothetical protein MLD38_019351 [Melastoma candidum]|uniref:Uncharacterized protein n=1 Tax=Melastoma candidum TaxID=119954 RepID=A0ACB9QXV3_9MYRT|nr:hypothetical protein MLD38_019351 [Melastoma candidum]
MQRFFPELNSSFSTLEFLCGVIWPGRKVPAMKGYDVFLSHRGIDTRRTVTVLLHDRLAGLGLRPFLDCKSMVPGDRLFERIDSAVLECRLGVAILSPRYCDSYHCLHELALMMESKKKVIPIFCDVKPSELHVSDSVICSSNEAQRFNAALEEARNIVGIPFNSANE